MSYPGNPSLSSDVQERILETFRQTLDLAAEGKLQEARLGCDFVLRLDASFPLAQELESRLEGAGGALVVDDLRARLDPPEGGSDELDELDLDALPDFEESLAEPSFSSGASDELGASLRSLLEERKLSAVMSLAQERAEEVRADPELANLARLAQERLEAQPYVESFASDARTALQEGDWSKLEDRISKIKALDATHPAIAELNELRVHYEDPDRLMGGRRVGSATPAVTEPEAEALPEVTPSAPPLVAEAAPVEGDDRVRQLLGEGQASFESGDYQSAIDSWSRIFLIDIDHAEASRRIEEARRLKAEQERKVEEVYHDALSHLEAGELEEGKARLQEVLELQPGHLSARDYLDRIDRGEDLSSAAGQTIPADAEVGAGPSLAAEVEGLSDADDGPLKEEILVPPEPGEVPERPAPPKPAKGGGRSFLVVGAAVLAVVLGGGFFLFQNWDRFFPNSAESVAIPTRPQLSPIDRATKLHAEGKEEIAISQLKKLSPDDPYFEEAKALLANWEVAVEGDGSDLDPEKAARSDRLLAAARLAADEGENLLATKLFAQASAIGELASHDSERWEEVQQKLAPLEGLMDYLQDGEFDLAVPELWKMRDADPENRDVARLLVTTYYNFGVRELRRGNFPEAIAQFDEALGLREDDPDLLRLRELATSYDGRRGDLLLRIYVKYIAERSL